MQAEGGMYPPPDGFLESLRELSDKHDLLLMFDEIQVAMDEKSYPAVGTFLQNCIETFLMHYLKARKV